MEKEGNENEDSNLATAKTDEKAEPVDDEAADNDLEDEVSDAHACTC